MHTEMALVDNNLLGHSGGVEEELWQTSFAGELEVLLDPSAQD